MRQWLPSTVRPSERVATTPSFGALDRVGAALGEHGHAVAREDVLDARAAASASSPGSTWSRDEMSVTLRAERGVGGGELGAGDTGSDDDEVLGDLVERVELRPGEDALAVGHRRSAACAGARRPRRRWCRRRSRRSRCPPCPCPVDTTTRLRPVEATVALDDAHAGLDELRLHVLGLLAREAQQPGVDGREVDRDLGAHRRGRSRRG